LTGERKTQHLPLQSAGVSLVPVSATDSHSSRRHWAAPSSVQCSVGDERCAAVTTMSTSTRYKTELCRTFAEHGSCRYGDRCQFAHGPDDLRAVARHPKYKTDLCRTYHTTGLCPYGPRCHFIHNDDEAAARRHHHCRPTAAEQQRQVELSARELELRLALLSLCSQIQKLQDSRVSSSAVTSPCFHVGSRSSTATATPPPGVPQLHVPIDRRQSVPVVMQSVETRPLVGGLSPPGGAGALWLDSVGNSPCNSSAADDSSPPPLSPTSKVSAPDAAARHLLDITTSNDHLNALIILAARLRLLQPTIHGP